MPNTSARLEKDEGWNLVGKVIDLEANTKVGSFLDEETLKFAMRYVVEAVCGVVELGEKTEVNYFLLSTAVIKDNADFRACPQKPRFPTLLPTSQKTFPSLNLPIKK